MKVPRPVNRSITLRKKTIEFIQKWVKDHTAERLKAGKSLTTVSVIREGLILWATEQGVLDELLKALKQSE